MSDSTPQDKTPEQVRQEARGFLEQNRHRLAHCYQHEFIRLINEATDEDGVRRLRMAASLVRGHPHLYQQEQP